MPNPLDMVTQDQRDAGIDLLKQAFNGGGQAVDANAVFQPSSRLTQAVAPDQTDIMSIIGKIKEYLATTGGAVNDTAKRFTNYDRQMTEDIINAPRRIWENPGKANEVGQRLMGGENWLSKMVTSGTTAPGNALASTADNPVTSENAIVPAMDMAGLAGGGALTERPGVATLGSGPVRPDPFAPTPPGMIKPGGVRPAIKYGDKIYKGDVGQEHMDFLPPEMVKSMEKTGVDINDLDAVIEHMDADPKFRTGFVDERGRFLNARQAGEHVAHSEGVVHPDLHNYLREGGFLTSDMLLSDTQQPGAAISAAAKSGPAPVFYSALEHATTNAAQDVMAPQQWLGYLKNQPGVKAEELAWTGLPDWLAGQKGKVKKEDVQSYLDEHKVEIKDVTKSGKPSHDSVSDDLHDTAVQAVLDAFLERNPKWEGKTHTRAFERAHEDFASSPEGEAVWDGVMQGEFQRGGAAPKYSDYQLPGGENYREHLLTMPRKQGDPQAFAKKMTEKYGGDNYYNKMTPEERAEFDKVFDGVSVPSSNDYKSSHWDEPNVLAHVRTNDRTMDAPPADMTGWSAVKTEDPKLGWAIRSPEGKPEAFIQAKDADSALAQYASDKKGPGGVKSLHIEEIQSDWHQEGRKQGYRPEQEKKMAELKQQREELLAEANKLETSDPRYKEIYKNLPRIQAEINDIGSGSVGVPDAPFKTTWPELALKRMIRHAAENGYDRISWTPGEAQASNPKVMARGHESQFSQAQIEANNKTDAGLREFYNKMLPKMAEKIGKAHGVKVKTGKISGNTNVRGGEAMNVPPKEIYETLTEYDPKLKEQFPTVSDFVDYYNDLNSERRADLIASARSKGTQSVHYFDIPQSLRDHAVGKGFPLYMSGVPFPLTPVDHDPFKEK